MGPSKLDSTIAFKTPASWHSIQIQSTFHNSLACTSNRTATPWDPQSWILLLPQKPQLPGIQFIHPFQVQQKPPYPPHVSTQNKLEHDVKMNRLHKASKLVFFLE